LLLIEKYTLSMRSALKAPVLNEDKRRLMTSRGDFRSTSDSREPLSLEQVSDAHERSAIVLLCLTHAILHSRELKCPPYCSTRY
jgi:hypothetical protein